MSRILIVEKNRGRSGILRSRMADLGHDLEFAQTGAEGVLKGRSGAFDLVLIGSDLGDGIGALETSQRLRATSEGSWAPIVVYADKPTTNELCNRLYEAGCEAVVGPEQDSALGPIVQGLLQRKRRLDEVREQAGVLDREHRRLKAEQQRRADALVAGPDAPLPRSEASPRPDGVLVVDAQGTILQADRGALEIFGSRIEGETLATLAVGSGLAAFVRDARTAPRGGFRFDLPARRGLSARSMTAAVMPLTESGRGTSQAARIVLVQDLGKRHGGRPDPGEPGVPRQQLAMLTEAARIRYSADALMATGNAGRQLRTQVVDVGRRSGPALVVGERGSGRSFVARVLHFGACPTGCCLSLRCSSLSEENLERELFGYVKGAFPEAVADRPGVLALARDGTLVLKEIDEMPMAVQLRLLEFLETGRLERLGQARSEPVAVRVIATTSADLKARARRGQFSPELYAKLSANLVTTPALRERPEDVIALAEHFLDRFRGFDGRVELDAAARWALQHYAWPGNIAELEDCIEQAAARAREGVVHIEHLSRPLRELKQELWDHEMIPSSSAKAAAPSAPYAPPSRPAPWEITADDELSFDLYEKKLLMRALDCCRGDKLAAARLLSVGKSTLYRKLKRYGIR